MSLIGQLQSSDQTEASQANDCFRDCWRHRSDFSQRCPFFRADAQEPRTFVKSILGSRSIDWMLHGFHSFVLVADGLCGVYWHALVFCPVNIWHK